MSQDAAESATPAAPHAGWPQYESHKIVRAARIIGIGIDGLDGKINAIAVRPNDEADAERFWPTEAAMAQRAEIGGYAVVYADGFRSISPAKAFEEGYLPVAKP